MKLSSECKLSNYRLEKRSLDVEFSVVIHGVYKVQYFANIIKMVFLKC